MIAGDHGYQLTVPTNADLGASAVVLQLIRPDGTRKQVTCAFANMTIFWTVAVDDFPKPGLYTGQFVATSIGQELTSDPVEIEINPRL